LPIWKAPCWPPVVPLTKERYYTLELLKAKAASSFHAGQHAATTSTPASDGLQKFLRDRPQREASNRKTIDALRAAGADAATIQQMTDAFHEAEKQQEAGLRGAVIVPEGKIAAGKLAQALMHGAKVIALQGNFDQALALVRELARRQPIALVNSVNDYRIEGQKTGAFEVCDELGEAPDVLCIPVGNAGNITAWWKGFREYEVAPKLHGYQAEGAAPLVNGAPVENPETVASAIRIGNPARWEDAMDAVTGSRGEIRAVSDAEILDAYAFLGAHEGVFCEPASAASVAGLLKHGAEGKVVCVLTGHGLKDPTTAMGQASSVIPCAPEIGAVEKAVFG